MGNKAPPPTPQQVQQATTPVQGAPTDSFAQRNPGYTTGSMGGGWGGFAPNPGQAGPGQQLQPFVSNPYQQGYQSPSTYTPGGTFKGAGPMGTDLTIPSSTTPGGIGGSMNNPFGPQGPQQGGGKNAQPPGQFQRPPAPMPRPVPGGGGGGPATIQPWTGAQPTLFADGQGQQAQPAGSFNTGRQMALAAALRR